MKYSDGTSWTVLSTCVKKCTNYIKSIRLKGGFWGNFAF